MINQKTENRKQKTARGLIHKLSISIKAHRFIKKEETVMRISVIIEPIVESERPELLIEKRFKQEVEHYAETRSICLAQYQVTFAAFNKVKFYLDFSTVVDQESVNYLENVAEFTSSKLKTSLLTHKEIIENVTYDINKADRIIYFDIILGQSTTQTSFIELLSYLNNC